MRNQVIRPTTLIAILLTIAVTHSACANPRALDYDDFMIKESQTGEAIGHVDGPVSVFRESLGAPIEVVTREFNFGKYVELRYDGIAVGYFEDKPESVHLVALTERRFTVLRGLGPGSQYSEFVSRLGEPEQKAELSDQPDLALFTVPNPRGRRGADNVRFQVEVGVDDLGTVQYVYLETAM